MANDPDFASDDDSPTPYMARTRAYYEALGYDLPYRWAHHTSAPFQPLAKPLRDSRLAIITTAAPYDPTKGDQGPGAAYNGAAKFYSVYSGDVGAPVDLRISHIAYDRTHTSADDMRTWFPLAQLRQMVGKGNIGELAPRYFGAPTNRSHRATMETDAPELLALCRDDNVDAVVLVPNCPVCHQTVSLVARYLEANGISTIVMGCAKDIVEHAAVPRFLFSDFPLGNSAGKPHDEASQAFTLELALRVLESAPAPQTSVQSPLRWSESAAWKLDYNNVARLSPAELQQRRNDFDGQKQRGNAVRDSAA